MTSNKPRPRHQSAKDVHRNQPRAHGFRLRIVAIVTIPLLASAGLFADWWRCIPTDTVANYVGRQSCATCHQGHVDRWRGSHHDLAMDLASEKTVLADFNDATLEHHGIVSRMYRDGDRFMINTEGPDGQLADFHVKYVFGVEPLQQFMVEFDRTDQMPETQIARLQVLRISWDTEKQEWFYLAPPDVDEKLESNDPLHWTGWAQNWNHMCADCHSTDVHKNFDVASNTYHTTFSEIDVSCEACHGPGSVHVQLANAKSLFWDRKLGYGLRQLKGSDHRNETETCAKCHSRRRMVHPEQSIDDGYYDCFANELLLPETYYADGQIRDEVYVYGSYIQSKMFHKEVRCSDCHDAHTARLVHQGNKVCTSCHQHPSAKYDHSGHHHHPTGSSGTSCIECHMPATPFMDVDFRRDHSLRIPRPDLSVQLKTPNACTGCHLDAKNVAPDRRGQLNHYSDWLAARDEDQQIADEIDRVDQWAAQWVKNWYGKEPVPHFATTLAAAWRNDPSCRAELLDLVTSRQNPAIVRASALLQLGRMPGPDVASVARRVLKDPDPVMRATAIGNLETLPRKDLLKYIQPMLKDESRLVRIEAARVLASVPASALKLEYRAAQEKAIGEYVTGLQVNADQAGAHMGLARLAEATGDFAAAVRAYRNAIRVQPDVAGPRSNLAALLEQAGQHDRVRQLRSEELRLLRRDAELAPEHASVQYRFGLSLYLNGEMEEAGEALRRACELEPTSADFLLALTLLNEKLQRWDDALKNVQQLRELRPGDPSLVEMEKRYQAQAAASRSGRRRK